MLLLYRCFCVLKFSVVTELPPKTGRLEGLYTHTLIIIIIIIIIFVFINFFLSLLSNVLLRAHCVDNGTSHKYMRFRTTQVYWEFLISSSTCFPIQPLLRYLTAPTMTTTCWLDFGTSSYKLTHNPVLVYTRVVLVLIVNLVVLCPACFYWHRKCFIFANK